MNNRSKAMICLIFDAAFCALMIGFLIFGTRTIDTILFWVFLAVSLTLSFFAGRYNRKYAQEIKRGKQVIG